MLAAARFAGRYPQQSAIARGSAAVSDATSTATMMMSAAAAAATHHQRRSIIVPRQLVAYGGHLNNTGRGGTGSISPETFLEAPKKLPMRRASRATTTFQEMLLPLEITSALKDELGVTVPSPVQQMAIRPCLRRENMIIAAPSGSGKTISYVAPIFANILEDRDAHGIPTRERRPRCIIVCPTQELVEQTADVCRRLGKSCNIHTVAVKSRRRGRRAVRRMLKRHLPDVLVASPHMVLKLIRARRLFLDDLRYFAADEADALVGPGHEGDAVKLMHMIEKRCQYRHLWPVATQRVLVTPTVSKMLQTYQHTYLPNGLAVIAPGTHELNRQVRHRFFKVVREGEKLDVLKWLLRSGGNEATPWPSEDPNILPVREHEWTPLPEGVILEEAAGFERGRGDDREDARAASVDQIARDLVPSPSAAKATAATSTGSSHHAAGRQGDGPLPHETAVAPARCVWQHLVTTSAPFTGHIRRVVAIPGERVLVFFHNVDRATALYHQLHAEGFKVALVHGTLPNEVRAENFQRWASGQCNVMLTTDLMARGHDYKVDRVINFDCPSLPLEYLLRAGRTGRMGRPGRVDTLAAKNQRNTVDVLRTFLAGAIPLERVADSVALSRVPTYAQYRSQKRDAVARRYIKLITTRFLPAHREKTYLRSQATWRPLFHPHTIEHHGGIPVRQQQKMMDRVQAHAIWRRRAVEATIKGGSAKFGPKEKRVRPRQMIPGIDVTSTNGVADMLPKAPSSV